jgi:hypothetical protein
MSKVPLEVDGSLSFGQLRHPGLLGTGQHAAERDAINLRGLKAVRLKCGSNQGHNLALTVLFVLGSLCSG